MRLDEQIRQQLQDLTMVAVAECLERLRRLRDEGFEFAKRTYPVPRSPGDGAYSAVEWTSTPDVPRHFKEAFGPAGGYKSVIPFEEVPAIQSLLEFVRSQQALREWLVPSRINDDNWGDRILDIGVTDLPLEIVDRHIHVAGWNLEEDVVFEIYRELEAWWLKPDLPVELWIPILGIGFEADSVELADKVRIVRLSAAEQLARWPGRRLDGQEAFVAMATHALVVPEWSMKNEDALRWLAPTDPPENILQAEHFLESLAIVTAEPSGYMQVAIRPVGWSPGYIADLPVMLTGALVADKRSTRLAPRKNPAVVLDDTQIEQLQEAYGAVSGSKEVALAATRLLSAERRSDSADRIVDLCVGLEALVSDAQGETTYKIAIRAAAMLAAAGTPAPSGFIGPMKTVYAHRSAVVHGRGSSKTDTVEIDGQAIPTEVLARDVLRQLLRVRMSDSSLTPQEIDRKLIGGALDQLAATVLAGSVD